LDDELVGSLVGLGMKEHFQPMAGLPFANPQVAYDLPLIL
jgi:hypothetical protein